MSQFRSVFIQFLFNFRAVSATQIDGVWPDVTAHDSRFESFTRWLRAGESPGIFPAEPALGVTIRSAAVAVVVAAVAAATVATTTVAAAVALATAAAAASAAAAVAPALAAAVAGAQ